MLKTSSKSTLCLNFGLSPMARSPVNASTSLQQQKRRAEIRLFECVKSRQIGERLENTVGELDAIIAQIDTQMRQQSDNNADTSSSRGPQSLPWISVVDAFAEELQRRVDMTNRNRNNIALNKLDTTTERTRVERLCDELNDQLSRRHGYIPNSGPSLQNKMERLDALLQEFSYNADTLPSSSANGATRAFSVQPQSQTPVMKRDLGRSRSSSSHSVRAWKSAAVRTCTALFDFVPQSAKEIAFRHGDVLRIHRQVDANWLEGERDGRIGVFPINYVQLNDKKHGHVTLRALFKFTPINANEMPLSQGEIVERIRNIDPYWIEGRNRCGRVGIFPRSYVAFVQNDGDEVVSSDTLSPPTRPKTPMLRDGLPASSLSLSTSSSSYFENNDIVESRPAATPRIYTKSPFHSTAPTTLQSAVAPLYANRSRSAGNLNFGRRVAASAATTVPWSEDASTSTTTPSLSLASIPNVSLADKTKTPTAKSASARRHSPSTDSLVARILADCPTTASSTSVTRRPLASSLRDTQPKREYRGRSVGTVDDVESASSFAKVFHKTVQRRLVPSINLEKYRSLYAYDPQHDDELKLLEGDVIHVVRKCDDGWFIGTQERTGQFGTFPGNYVTRV